jgi:hypothetical protein
MSTSRDSHLQRSWSRTLTRCRDCQNALRPWLCHKMTSHSAALLNLKLCTNHSLWCGTAAGDDPPSTGVRGSGGHAARRVLCIDRGQVANRAGQAVGSRDRQQEKTVEQIIKLMKIHVLACSWKCQRASHATKHHLPAHMVGPDAGLDKANRQTGCCSSCVWSIALDPPVSCPLRAAVDEVHHAASCEPKRCRRRRRSSACSSVSPSRRCSSGGEDAPPPAAPAAGWALGCWGRGAPAGRPGLDPAGGVALAAGPEENEASLARESLRRSTAACR